MRQYKNNIILHVRNITLHLENIKRHLTEKPKIITLCLAIIMLSFINVTFTSALSYQTETGIRFTFNPTITISLSDDLTIQNLVPGTTADSNTINISVATNTSYGYTVSALANSDNLIHSNNTNMFNSITANANLENLATDNTWGYSYKNNMMSTTWSNYNGLSTITNKVLYDTDNITNSSIDFKIAAKASNTQPSGTYANTINFYAVAKPTPQTIDDLTYLQGFASLSPTDLASVKNSMPMNYTYILKDQRDEQEYTIAKLADGKIWMTKNLNLAGGTEITSELSDIPEDYTLPTANGFQARNKLPESSRIGFSDDTQAYVYNSSNNTDVCSDFPGCYSYYSWHAATVGSGIDISTDNTDAPYSICPKGWRLPNSRSTVAGNSDFYQLAIAYGMGSNSTRDFTETGSNFYNQAGPNTISNFLLTGYLRNAFQPGVTNGGYCWSSTSYSNLTFSYSLRFSDSFIMTADNNYRKDGDPVRCLAR